MPTVLDFTPRVLEPDRMAFSRSPGHFAGHVHAPGRGATAPHPVCAAGSHPRGLQRRLCLPSVCPLLLCKPWGGGHGRSGSEAPSAHGEVKAKTTTSTPSHEQQLITPPAPFPESSSPSLQPTLILPFSFCHPGLLPVAITPWRRLPGMGLLLSS